MASDFSAAWQCLSKRTIGFFVTDQTPRPNCVLFITSGDRLAWNLFRKSSGHVSIRVGRQNVVEQGLAEDRLRI
jgi:hypothetical protein